MTHETTLDVLLVEDNPGDARYIEELLRDATELSERTLGSRAGDYAERPLMRGSDEPTLRHETRLEDGLAQIEMRRPDIILLDLDLPDSKGIETLETVLDRVEDVPVVVLTGISDRSVGIEAIRRGADEYLAKDELNADLFVRSVYHAIERRAHERHLEQQRQQLEALNQLHEVVHGIVDTVIEQSTREEIEATVCEQLAAAPSYEFAWIGEVDSTSDEVVVRTAAGDEGYLDDVTISTNPDDAEGRGPTGQAVRTEETQVMADIYEDEAYEPWREKAETYGYRSSAAIPIAHDGTLYGVLNVYASRPRAFAGEEREVVGQIGEIVGHAIAAVDRKRTLMSDEVVEVDIQIPSVLPTDAAAGGAENRITLERTVPIGDEYRLYGTAHPDDMPAVQALVDAQSHWLDLEVVSGDGARSTFELRLADPSLLTLVASQGGDVKTATIEDGDLTVVAQFPHSEAVRQAMDHVETVYPDAVVQAQRMVTRSEDWSDRVLSAFEESLTDRQRAILETAYFRGYFEWPRESSGEEIAESVDLSSPTFSEHLRGAENRIFGALFEDGESDEVS